MSDLITPSLADIRQWLEQAQESDEREITIILSSRNFTFVGEGTPEQLIALFKDNEQEEQGA